MTCRGNSGRCSRSAQSAVLSLWSSSTLALRGAASARQSVAAAATGCQAGDITQAEGRGIERGKDDNRHQPGSGGADQ